jgi:hypothetical protein
VVTSDVERLFYIPSDFLINILSTLNHFHSKSPSIVAGFSLPQLIWDNKERTSDLLEIGNTPFFIRASQKFSEDTSMKKQFPGSHAPVTSTGKDMDLLLHFCKVVKFLLCSPLHILHASFHVWYNSKMFRGQEKIHTDLCISKTNVLSWVEWVNICFTPCLLMGHRPRTLNST